MSGLFFKKSAMGFVLTLALTVVAKTETRIVAIGASNTLGFGVGSANAYPAQLEAMLKAHGYNVKVTNAGIPGETTNGMLARIDSSVPAGTKIVILQPGGNDLRFGVPMETRAKNIREITARLQRRGIHVIIADNLQGLLVGNSFDGIHFNTVAHGMIAKKLYPRVVSALGGGVYVASTLPTAIPKQDAKTNSVRPGYKQ
jgi:acyl-CoA thioesterase I